jgi:hypothetical protein
LFFGVNARNMCKEESHLEDWYNVGAALSSVRGGQMKKMMDETENLK